MPTFTAFDVIFVEEQDSTVNPLGVNGVGELGVVGTAAAIANAVFHEGEFAYGTCRFDSTRYSGRLRRPERHQSCAWRIHKLTQQSVSGTARDSASASDARQNLSATQVRLVPLPPKVFATLVAFAEACPSAAKSVSWPRAMRFCSVGVGGI